MTFFLFNEYEAVGQSAIAPIVSAKVLRVGVTNEHDFSVRIVWNEPTVIDCVQVTVPQECHCATTDVLGHKLHRQTRVGICIHSHTWIAAGDNDSQGEDEQRQGYHE
jgi:hypothetical protein